ncbi:DEAD/DEAH box helicase [Actinobacillus delphinicola]|uniref:type I restriction endonuclease subunit R n=1 Tax=Actinobacillus delphinicola TaxID=51161 RepID=UPI002441647B|nr:type I restriction endonuclease subunit R [Actinobacillus delphinicola]MDG6897385.1 DEAD/DEAH box helicase [Actinobacillus delphinicola]
MTTQTSTIAESNNFIVLDKYDRIAQANNGYQSEAALEQEFIEDLVRQGYRYRKDLNSQEKLLANVRQHLERLNQVRFTDAEWQRFVEEYLDKASENLVDKARKVHQDYIYDFVFDDGDIKNIYLFDKKDLNRNQLEVINQFEQQADVLNRYDVTILINGLPMVQVELKRRGVKIAEAFNQVHRYSKESFNSAHSLFKFLQIFVISNGTDTRYFANTTKRDKNSFDFTMNWACADNTLIKDLKDFTATFFERRTLLKVLFQFSVLDSNDTLLIMRPYQIAATERILWKIQSSFNAKNWSNTESGGYIWHTTGSGKTLTSFKAARLATELPFIDKVFFVVDRKDLDYQTMKEYQRFSPDSVNGSANTAALKSNLEKDDNKIIVTTIQKLNNLMKTENDLPVYHQQVVFIFDECHRSQFGEAQKNLQKKFKKYYQFGFTGTPIFPENALTAETTASVFGNELHSYVITDAIRDNKVLRFKVDYNDVRPAFREAEKEVDLDKLTAFETKQVFLHPQRIEEVCQYVLENFDQKTHRRMGNSGFNAMFAVSSVDAAKVYYETFKRLQAGESKPLTVATIFSFAANEEQNAVGDIVDENFEPTAMESSSKEFLMQVMADYNQQFATNFTIDGNGFQNYYRDLAQKVKDQQVDLLIVVGMFLTGFDVPRLNTLFVDKNLRYHGLIQAFSRTNRIYQNKNVGNIVTFRDLEEETKKAITLFGNASTRQVVLERSFEDYVKGYTDKLTGEIQRGYLEIVQELNQCFPDPTQIETEADKRKFVKLFGEYLRLDNALQNFDEYAQLQKYVEQVAEGIAEPTPVFLPEGHILAPSDLLNPRQGQDYRSVYNDIREWRMQENKAQQQEKAKLDWDDIVFEVDLLKSLEINLDYILELIFKSKKKSTDKSVLVEDVRKIIRSSLGQRAKEDLIIDFIHSHNLDKFADKDAVIDAFYDFAQQQLKQEAEKIIVNEGLNPEPTRRYLALSLKRGFASENGRDLNECLPKLSPMNPKFRTLKQTVLAAVNAFVDKFRDIGGDV